MARALYSFENYSDYRQLRVKLGLQLIRRWKEKSILSKEGTTIRFAEKEMKFRKITEYIISSLAKDVMAMLTTFDESRLDPKLC